MGFKRHALPDLLTTASLAEALFWPRSWQVWCLFTFSLAITLVGWATVPEAPSLDRIPVRQTSAFESSPAQSRHRSWDGLAVIAPVAAQLSHWSTRDTVTDTALQFSGPPAVIRGLIQRLATVGVISSYVLKGDAPRLHRVAELTAELHMADTWVVWTPQLAAEFMHPLGLVGKREEESLFFPSPGEATLPVVPPLMIDGLRLLATVSGPSGAYALIEAPEGLLRVRAGDLIGDTGARVAAISREQVQLANGVVLQWR